MDPDTRPPRRRFPAWQLLLLPHLVSVSAFLAGIALVYAIDTNRSATSRAAGITSDARTRFERGVDPAFLDEGVADATHLVLELCGGAPSEVTRAGAVPDWRRTVRYRPRRALKRALQPADKSFTEADLDAIAARIVAAAAKLGARLRG